MSDSLEQKVDFKINSEEVSRVSEQIKKDISGVGATAQAAAEEVKKSIEKSAAIQRDQAAKSASDQKKASKETVNAVDQETKAHERATEAIKKKQSAFDASGKQIKPVGLIYTSQDANTDALNKPITSGSPVGAIGDANRAQFEEAAKAAEYYKNKVAEANQVAVESTNKTTEAVKNSITATDAVGKSAAQASQIAADSANRHTEAVKNTITAEDTLRARLDSYKSMKGSATDPAVVVEYTNRIKETQAEIDRLKNVGKRGYDEMGNRIKSTIGLQEQLNARLRYFQDQLQYAKAPQSFVTLNRKIQETEEQLNRLANAGKKGFDDLGNKIAVTDTIGGKFIATLKSIGAAMLAAFSLQMLLSWGMEAKALAAKGEGIREAFAKLGDEKTLEMLRKATRGATSDIDLMAAALRAKNFQITPALLSKGLELAGKVSRQTGQDVTYLADSFVNGLGRKSLLILDNLQISQVQLRAEIRKTGDFQTAVANVVDAKLKQMGEVAETSADRSARWATRIANIKEKIGQGINMVINYDALKEANKEFYETGLQVNNLQKNIAPLLTSYDQLTAKAEKNGGVTKLSKQEQALLKDIIKQVGDVIPGAITQFDKYGNAMSISTDRAREFIKQQVLVMQALNENRIDETSKKLGKLSRELAGLQDTEDQMAKTGTFKIPVTTMNEQGGSITKFKDATEKQKQAVIARRIEVSAEIEKLNALLNSDSGTLLVDKQKEIDAFSKTTKIDDGKAEEKERKSAERQQHADAAALEAQKSLLQRIELLKDQFAARAKSKEQQTHDAIVKDFKQLSFDIEKQGVKYDAYAKKYGTARATAVLGEKQTLGQLKPIQEAAIADLEERQEVERTKIKIEQEKKLYTDFEEFKTTLGTKAAKERFEKEINTEQTRLQNLQSKKAPLLLTDPSKLTGAQSDYLTWLNLQIEAEKEAQNKAQLALLKESQDFEQQKLNLKEIYEEKIKNLQGDALAANREQVKKNYQEQLDSLISTNNAKSDLSRKLAEEAIILTRRQIVEQIKILENAMKDITIPDEFKEKIKSQISGLNLRLNVGADQANLDTLKERRNLVIQSMAAESKKAKPDLTTLKKNLADINAEIYKLDKNGDGKAGGLERFLGKLSGSKALKQTAEWANVAADGLMTMSTALGGVDTEAGYTLDTIGQLVGTVGNLAGAIVSGDPVQMVGAAIKAVGTIFSLGKKVKEMNLAARKEVADFYAQAIAGEREYQDLLKQRSLQTIRDNKTALQGISDEIALRKAQNDEYGKEALEIMGKLQGLSFTDTETYKHGTLFRKAKIIKTYGSLEGKNFEQLSQLLAQGKLEGDAKVLVERLKELEQKGYDAEQALKDLAKQTQEIFTGTTSDNLTNSLLEMFRSGKMGVTDLADFFKQTMDDAALSIFKNKVLAGVMDQFYDEFVKKMDNGDITQSDYAELSLLFQNLTDDAKAKFEALKKITGSDLSGNTGSNSGLSGAIKKELTDEGVSILTGLNRDEYLFI